MDEFSSRRSSGGLVVSRRGPSLLRDLADNNRDRNVQVCSRAGCSSRLNQMKDAQIGSPSKAKTLRTPFRSTHGKEIVGSSSKAPTLLNTSRKSFSGSKKKISFNLESSSESSSIQDDSEEASDSTPKSGKTQIRVHPEPNGQELGNTSGPTNRPVKRKTQRLGLGKQDSGVPFSSSFPFKTSQGSRNGASTSRYNLRNLRCNSISDVVPSGCSSPPESSLGSRKDTGKKRIGEPGNSLTSRGKKMNGPTLSDRKNDNSNRGVSISDSRPTRNLSPRNPRSTVRTRLSNQYTRNRLPVVEAPSSPERDISLDGNAFSSDDQISVQIPSFRSTSFSRPGSSNGHMRPNRSVGPYDVGISRSFMNRDALRQYGIAEMLLALDRIEQDEEPNYEQLLVLETNLFLGGLAFHDQHREMRLDIDNMSYEELLALGDRMGTVSTPVPEEDLAKCLEKSVFQGTMDCSEDENDIKCSICQEEYAEGDEVGRLECDHRYHIECVNQWLRLKNWCPICKASATPSSP
ncbi:uncharacterized protein LOC141653419 [Silene latifolia]|uniref:uncharacterized protein LOC141653419 n=1 Tax=Silene latifolia TaxID=37657 RepID=UPI003D779402